MRGGGLLQALQVQSGAKLGEYGPRFAEEGIGLRTPVVADWQRSVQAAEGRKRSSQLLALGRSGQDVTAALECAQGGSGFATLGVNEAEHAQASTLLVGGLNLASRRDGSLRPDQGLVQVERGVSLGEISLGFG